MNKKLVKVFSIILMVIMLCSIALNVFAAGVPQPSTIIADNSLNTDDVQTIGKKMVTVLQTIGIILSVIILIVLGIKYMMGSAEEKAEYKKTMIPYLVGALLIFSASALAQVIYNVFSGWGANATK